MSSYSASRVLCHNHDKLWHNVRNQNQNSLLVKRQNDNTSPGLGRGRVPRSHKRSEFRFAVRLGKKLMRVTE